MKKVAFLVVLCAIASIGFSRTLSYVSPGLLANNGSATGVIDFFRTMDAKILVQSDEKKVSYYLRRKNDEIIKYIALNYPAMGDLDIVDANDPAATWFCLLFAICEANRFITFDGASGTISTAKGVPVWLSCTLGVVGAAYGVTELLTGLGNFTVGAAWKVAKFIVKKYVLGWLGTAIALYEVATKCF